MIVMWLLLSSLLFGLVFILCPFAVYLTQVITVRVQG